MISDNSSFNLRRIVSSKREKLIAAYQAGKSIKVADESAQINREFDPFMFLHSVGYPTVGHAVEVGSSYPYQSQFRDEILRVNSEICMVEIGHRKPLPSWHPTTFSLIDVRQEVCATLSYSFGHFENVKIYNIGISDTTGTKKMIWKDGSTYEDGVLSPNVQNFSEGDGRPQAEFTAKCFSFGDVDTGNIGLLAADVEGNEYYVIKTMKSRPIIITLELYTLEYGTMSKSQYMNPYIDEISQWMNENYYIPFNFSAGDVAFLRADFYDTLKEEGKI